MVRYRLEVLFIQCPDSTLGNWCPSNRVRFFYWVWWAYPSVAVTSWPQTIPFAVKPDAAFCALYLNPSSGDQLRCVSSPGSTLEQWPDAGARRIDFRCEVKNIGHETLSYIGMTFAIQFESDKAKPREREVSVSIPRALAPNESFILYIHDDTDGWAPLLKLPLKATVRSGGPWRWLWDPTVSIEYPTKTGEPTGLHGFGPI